MTPSAPSKRLLLSIHDVSPRFESQVDRLHDLLSRYAPVDRIALLVVPNHWGTSPITPGSPFATKLRDLAHRGAELFLHGYFHRDDSKHDGRLARLKATQMTAGEGEFLGIDEAAARIKMQAGKSLLEDIAGTPVAGFIAPAWLYGPGTSAALAEMNFALAENHFRVWQPGTGRTLARDPVLTWPSRSRSRILSSLAAARTLPLAMRFLPTARIGVHPGDARVPAIMTSIERAVAGLVQTHEPARYADLMKA